MPNDLFVPPGHYYSPIPGDDEIQRYWKYREQPLPQTIASIDFNAREQDENLSVRRSRICCFESSRNP